VKDLLFFSNNQHKIIEISKIFSKTSINILSLNNFKKIKSPDETGLTFEENAKIKSQFGLEKFKKNCFSDDSGICIDSMNGFPGINSKKFLEEEKGSQTKLKKIILTAKNKNNFNAFFQTTICLSLSKNKNIFFTGKIKGKISKEIKGVGGFGYDPIFIPSGHKLTFAEMNVEEKNLFSHRFKAISKLIIYINKLI